MSPIFSNHTQKLSIRQCKARKIAIIFSILLLLAEGAILLHADISIAGNSNELPLQAQIDEYQAPGVKSILELQQFRTTTSIMVRNNTGKEGTATLINLNPHINAWFLLTLQWNGTRKPEMYHLDNRDPSHQHVLLDPQYLSGLIIAEGGANTGCDLWSGASDSELGNVKASQDVYVPLCGGRLYVRKKTEGHKTTKEWATDFLRNYVPGGEQITVFVRKQFYQDAFLNTSDMVSADTLGTDASRPKPPGAPARPLINPRYDTDYLIPAELGIAVEYEIEGKMLVGRWYHVKDLPGVFISVIQPNLVADDVITSQQGKVNPLDEVELSALTYMVAFDLDRFENGFAMGTEHPRVDWSDRVRPDVRNPALPGPDGIGTIEPLVNTGMVNPVYAGRIAATFIGGFKRYHGAFKLGDFALKNHGTHYGFLEQGVVMSKLQSGLATVLVWDDGRVELKTWTDADNAHLAAIRHARQNGLPIIEYDAATNLSQPGALVARHGLGNWSGSVDGKYRTLRAGLGFQEYEGTRFLIYGYFSSATPSAMAQVFQAYHCQYAMQLDMNALEHTYLAVYRMQETQFDVQHLITGMNVLDRSSKGQVAPRFVGYADNRDFFYLLWKGRVPE